MKKYEDLQFSDDFMFGIVMGDDELCRKFLERILQQPVDKLVTPEKQKEIRMTSDGKSIRLDIYTQESSSGTVYDAEMQKLGNKKLEDLQLPRRSRYYQSLIDTDMLVRGNTYKKLKESNVIFICTFDPFEKGLYKYTFSEECQENKGLLLEDGTRRIFYNTKSTDPNMPPDVKKLFDYINTSKATDELTKEIGGAVQRARQNSEWGSYYMKTFVHDMDVREEGREEGRVEGREEGQLQMLLELYREGTISLDVIKEKTGKNDAQIEEVLGKKE